VATAQARPGDSAANANPRKIRKVSEDCNEQETDKIKQLSPTAFGVGDETRRSESEQPKMEENAQESTSGQVDGVNKQTRGEDDYSRFKGRGRYNKDQQRCVVGMHCVTPLTKNVVITEPRSMLSFVSTRRRTMVWTSSLVK
jgi:hypothetical protein